MSNVYALICDHSKFFNIFCHPILWHEVAEMHSFLYSVNVFQLSFPKHVPISPALEVISSFLYCI